MIIPLDCLQAIEILIEKRTENGITTDNSFVTTDNSFVTTDNSFVTTDNSFVTTDNSFVTTDKRFGSEAVWVGDVGD